MLNWDLCNRFLSYMSSAGVDDDSLRNVARFHERFSEEPAKQTPARVGSPSSGGLSQQLLP